MKIKNIIEVLCFLFIALSCSTEDDILSGVDTKGSAGIDAKEVYASLDISLLVGNANVTTKSSELTGPTNGTEEDMTENEKSVSNCYIAIFKYDSKTKNVGDFLTSYYSSNGSISESLIFKISKDKSERTDLKIVVIANAAASVSKYDLVSAGKISYADLKGKTLVEAPGAFVKVGETEIQKGDEGNYPDDKGGVYVNISEKILNLEQPAHTPVEIKLIQRTAAIMLQQFKILKSNGSAYDDVAITCLSLENCKAIGKVAGEVSSGENLYVSQSVDDSAKRLYSYENTTTSQPTTLKIDYVYNNGETGSCSFPIKSRLDETSGPSLAVWAGYLYKLEVTLRNATVDVAVKCVTQDWIFDKDHEFEFTF